MPEDDPITESGGVTDRAPINDTPVADKEVVAESPDADAQNAAAKPSVDALLLYDAGLGSAFPTALRDVFYANATMVPVEGWADVRSALSRYARINTLIVYSHSTPGEIVIGDRLPTASEQRATLAASGAKVKSAIVFEGCSIMADPAKAARMVSGIAEPSTRVIGSTYYGITHVITVTLAGSESVADVHAMIDVHGDFLLPIIPSPDALAGTRETFTLYKRWYRPEFDASHLPALHPGAMLGGEHRNVKSREELVPVTVSSAEEAEALRSAHQSMPSPQLVTVADVEAVINDKKVDPTGSVE